MHSNISRVQFNKYLKRERVQNLLSEAISKGIVTITADAGYGKTQSVLFHTNGINTPVIWISFSELDNYAPHFWKNFVSSLKTIDLSLAEKAAKLDLPTDAASFHLFVKTISPYIHQRNTFTVVLDDCHLLTNHSIKDFIINLISLETLSIYIISRTDQTPLHQDLAKIKYETIKISSHDLSFTIKEINEYFQLLNFQLPFTIIKTVYQETDGWPFAIYLAALSLHDNAGSLITSGIFVNQLLFDTIEKEIFSKYNSHEQDFLIRISLLDYFPIRLAQHLFQDEIKQHLNSMANNALIRYNAHTQSFQFHQLFKEFLQDKQPHLDPHIVHQTLHRAAKWFHKNGMAIDALACYKKINDHQALWQIILELMPTWFPSHIYELLAEIIHSFPKEFFEKNPLTQVVLYLIYPNLYGHKKNISLIYEAIDQLKTREQTEATKIALGESHLILGLMLMHQGRTDFLKHFEIACTLTDSSLFFSKPCMILFNGTPITLCRCSQGEIDAWLTYTEKAAPLMDRLLGYNMRGFSPLTKAAAHYYRGDFNLAHKYALQAIYQGKENHCVDIVNYGYFILLKIAMFKSNYDEMYSMLENINLYTDRYCTEPFYNGYDIVQGWLYAYLDALEKIPDWIIHEEMYLHNQPNSTLGAGRVIKAYCLLTQGHYDEMVLYLQHSQKIYQNYNLQPNLIHIHTLLAIGYSLLKDYELSYCELVIAYNLSYKNGITTIFIEYNRHIKNCADALRKNIPLFDLKGLMEKAAALYNYSYLSMEPVPMEWLDIISSKAATFSKKLHILKQQYQLAHDNANDDTNPLSVKEIDVLNCLCNGLTREEIAADMGLSVNTVKNMLNSIYAKLGALNGMHAVKIGMLKGYIS